MRVAAAPSGRTYSWSDNLDRLEDPSVMDPFQRIIKTAAVRLVGAVESRNLTGYTQNVMLSEIRREPNVLMLEPDAASDVFWRSVSKLDPFRPRRRRRPTLPDAVRTGG